MSSTELPPDAPSPRFCHLVKWPDFDGYGFNLHAEKSKPGQYIGKVDEGSPAEAAGLRTADRIIEVNGVNIANENHKQVVERIKAVLNETKLLVVDDETDRWYKERKLVIRGNQPNISYLKTPDTRHQTSSPVAQTDKIASENVERDDDEESFKSVEQDSQDNSKTPSVAGSAASTPSFGRKENEEKVLDQPEEKNEVNKTNDSHAEKNGKVEINNSNVTSQKEAFTSENSPKKEINPKNVNETSSAGSISQGSSVNGEKLNLNMSVQEMRAMLASRKKHDPKKDSMDFRQKYAIIQDM